MVLLTAFAATQQYLQLTSPSSQVAELTPPKNFILNQELTADPNQLPVPTLAPSESTPEQLAVNPEQAGSVLGDQETINFRSSSNSGSNGGLLVLNAKDTPVISVETYQTSGNGSFKLYKANKTDLLNYLLYKRNDSSAYGASIEKIFKFDTNSVPVEKTFEQQIVSPTSNDNPNDITLPIEGVGIWFLEGTVNGIRTETMVVRSNMAAIVHKGDNQNIFWVQSTDYANVADASVELFNTENAVTSLKQITTNQDGLVTDSSNDALDIAVVTKGDDLTVIPVSLINLNYRTTANRYGYSSFSQRQPDIKSFMFTDRFLYKPGDTLNFKAIIRNDDDADYTIAPRTFKVTFGGYDNPFWEKNLTVSELGTIDGSIPVPEDAEAGYYSVVVKEGDTYISTVDVQVANFRKPDSSVEASTDKMMYLPGERMTVNVSGSSFLGQPLRNEEVRYKLYQRKADVSGDYTTATFNSGFGYAGQDAPITEGVVKLDRKGKGSFEITAKNSTGFRQFWSVSIEYLDAGGTAANDVVQALIQPGDFIIERDVYQGGFYQGKEVSYPVKLSKNKIDAVISNMPVTAKLLVSDNQSNEYVTEKDDLKATSDATGKMAFVFTPQQQQSYKLEFDASDKQGNPIKGEESFYASNAADANNKPIDIFEIKADKETYNIGDTAKVTITTRPEIKNVFVSIGRSYSREHRVLPVNNGIATFEFSVIEKYQPNVHIMVGSFLDDVWKSETIDRAVNLDDKHVTVTIKPSQTTYGPAETASFEITTTDQQGRPVATDLAFWIFDKALLELHGNYFEGIFNQFWSERFFSIPTHYSYEGITSTGAEGGGGCFAGETLVTMADGTKKRIDQVVVGDEVSTFISSDSKELTAAKVTGTHQVKVAGYLILNGTLKITPEHKLLVNNQWKTAGEIEVGDTLLSDQGSEIKITSIEWVRGKFTVYNLTVEKFHTFFANDTYVHNEKGEVRSVFKDTAYWNPHVTTGQDGKATVSFTLPDNLTTWIAASVAANGATQVGDGKTEIIVTKDLVVRPIFPSFLRTGDEITLTALIQNFTQQSENFSIEASLEGGKLGNERQTATVASEDMAELTWPVTVTGKNEDAVFSVKATSDKTQSLTDTVIEKLPIYEYGSWLTNYSMGENSAELPLNLDAGTDANRAEAVLTLKASKYPELQANLTALLTNVSEYSGVEDSAGGLIAASILKQHGTELGLTYSDAKLTEAVQKATSALKRSRAASGVWITYPENTINAAQSRFAVEAMIMAKEAGFAVEQQLIDQAVSYFDNWVAPTWEDQVEQQYVFSLVSNGQHDRKKIPLTYNSSPSHLARAVLANHRQGFINSTEEEAALIGVAHKTETQIGWTGPVVNNQERWNQIALPTAWSVLASQEVVIESLDPALSLDYLYRNVESDPELRAVQSLATVKYYLATEQASPNYQYKVLAGETELASGSVNSTQQVIAPIIMSEEVLNSGSPIRVETTGKGKLFSELAVKQFYTDPALDAQQHNISLTRKYLSTKPAGEATKVGDMVVVQFKVEGLGLGETEVTIEDYLPSGLVAIDETLDNGIFDPNGPNSSFTSQQITEQGMRLSFSRLSADGTYSYKTRVISEGVFNTPPATVTLVNQPSIWASTAAETLKIDGKNVLESTHDGIQSFEQQSNIDIIAAAVLAIGMIALLVAYRFRDKIRGFIQKKRNVPPTPPPPVVTPPIQ